MVRWELLKLTKITYILETEEEDTGRSDERFSNN